MSTIDEALAIFHRTGPEYAGGLANHGPMAAEALNAMGRTEAIIPWVEKYNRLLQSPPDAANPISEENWKEALADFRRVGDWMVFFDRQLEESHWPVVLDQWVQRLAPGLVAAAFHGLLRTGHAVRSLAAHQTPQRRHELAEGLAYWAARYNRLPETPSSETGALLPSAAVRLVPSLPAADPGGLISHELIRLDDYPAFASVINLVDTSGDAARFISDLTETFAQVYWAHRDDPALVFRFLHAVTGPSALRLLLPYLSAKSTEAVLRYGWQAAAALYVAFNRSEMVDSVITPDEDRDDLIDRAVANGDEHVIKFTEACLREYALNPHPVYLASARHVLTQFREG